MEQLINFLAPEVQAVLPLLLQDKSTQRNIIWATDPPLALAGAATDKSEMTVAQLQQMGYDALLPRQLKQDDDQRRRTRKKGEVFTPAWVCNKMNNALDADWFGQQGRFNTETAQGWQVTPHPVLFEAGQSWQAYVDSRRLEITCGEAPFLVSRYDAATGQSIPPAERIGILDRKLRVVTENTCTEADWLKWVYRALQATYGYEYQGDSLLLARTNLLLAFVQAVQERLHRSPTTPELKKAANILVWNLWQMDGLKQCVPGGKRHQQHQQLDFFSLLAGEAQPVVETSCRVRNWRSNATVFFGNIQEGSNGMKFDYVIGNPPYQEQVSDDDKNSSLAKQLFPDFIKESTTITDKLMLITPSRWFTGDAQDKSFLKLREFIRENNHIKYLCNYPDAREVFPNAEIKGGVNYFIFDKNYAGKVSFEISQHGETTVEVRNLFEDGLDVIISDRTTYSILSKVIYSKGFQTINEITRGRNAFGIIGKEDVVNSKSKKEHFNGAIKLYCKAGEIRWTELSEITKGLDIVHKYKVFISKSAGSPGKDLKIIGNPYVGECDSVCTDSLFPIGNFETFDEADNLKKYMKTRFLRFMVSIMKMSQNVTQLVYKFVPLQDFTHHSDIDWSVPVAQIDQQLYRKYGLTAEEIDFIETHVKEMV